MAGTLAAAADHSVVLASCCPRRDVVIVRLVGYCGGGEGVSQSVGRGEELGGFGGVGRASTGVKGLSIDRKGGGGEKDSPQVLHEVANGTCDFFVFVQGERDDGLVSGHEVVSISSFLFFFFFFLILSLIFAPSDHLLF